MKNQPNASTLIHFDVNINTCNIGTYPPDLKVTLSKDLQEILGFNDDEISGLPTASVRPPDILRGMTALYVYVDIVAPRIVGDTRVPLLRTVPIGDVKPHDNVFVPFSNPQFVPVTFTNTRVIKTRVCRDDGTVVDFKSGKTILNLELRRVDRRR